MTTALAGLEGVVVADTELSDVDGERGELIVRGFFIEDLVGRATFEDVAALMWTGRRPSSREVSEWQQRFGDGRQKAFALLPSIGDAFAVRDGMDALRAALAHVRLSGDHHEDAIRLTAATAVFAAAWARASSGEGVIEPDPALSHAADYLRMVTGRDPAPPAVNAMDSYLCCVVDHGLNASTFAARVVASTGSDLVSAVVAGIGALKGPLHGGAPGPVLDMLDAIGDAAGATTGEAVMSRAREWLAAQIAAGQRIMGMGHRVYRVRDPRAAALERSATRLQATGGGGARLALARAVEREAEALLAERHPERRIRANVEFYTAVLLEAIDIPRTLFSPTFAAARVVGWCAHYEEQRRRGRLMRPLSNYVGPRPSRGPM